MTLYDLDSIKILYEDDNFLAVDKPEGIASISENDTSIHTIHSVLEKKYSTKIFIVHRIDKEVSGIILFAKNPQAHKYLNDLFASRSIKKNYIALVRGKIKYDRGRIDKPIREFGSGRMGIDEKRGKRSIADYKVIQRFNEFTLLDVSILTGRRHQIRVHLYSMGHPVAGDLRYGEIKMQKQFARLMLHASRIEFPLQDKTNKIIASPLPEMISKFISNLQ